MFVSTATTKDSRLGIKVIRSRVYTSENKNWIGTHTKSSARPRGVGTTSGGL